MLSLNFMAARAHAEELRRAASSARAERSTQAASQEVTLRRAAPGDAPRLSRLAALDCSAVPSGPTLIAEVGGSLRAALPLDGAPPIADPFYRGDELIELLSLRATQLGLTPRRRRARTGRARGPAV